MLSTASNGQPAFVAQIAGHTFGIYDGSKEMRRRFAPYLSDETEPEFHIDVAEEEIAARAAQGIAYPRAQLVEDHIARALLTRDVLHVHASAIRYRGRAYLFSAPSGTGKSTHARLWREAFGAQVAMINDDKPFLRFEAERIVACGSPWNGRHNLGANLEAPLGGICMLAQGSGNRIERLSRGEAFFLLVRQVYIWDDPEDTRKILGLLERLVTQAPVYRLSCEASAEAALLARDTLVGSSDETAQKASPLGKLSAKQTDEVPGR